MRTTWPRAGGPGIAVATRWTALLTLLMLLLSALPADATATPAPPEPGERRPADEPQGDVVVVLTEIEPAILQPGADLVVRGTVTNDSTTPLAEPQLRLRAQQHTPISRSMLERWLEPDQAADAPLVLTETLEEPLPAGAKTHFTLRVTADDLPLAQSYVAWGPRGFQVSVDDAADPLDTAGTVRSYLLWWPDITVETMPLAVLGTASPTAAERTAARTAGTAVADTAAERLVPLLAALDHPAVDIAVDPSLLTDPPALDLTEDADAATGTPTPATTQSGETSTGSGAADEGSDSGTAEDEDQDATAAQLRAVISALARTPARALHALPWADADIAAAAHTDRGDLLRLGDDLTGRALDGAGLVTGSMGEVESGRATISTDIAWPVGDEPDANTLTAATESGSTAVVLPDSALAVQTPLTYTPSGRAVITVDGAEVAALLVDDRLSALLTGRHLPIDPQPGEPPAPLDALTARQFLLAETAVIARERPIERRDLVLALPRELDVDADALAARLAALDSAPWLDRVGAAEVLAHEPSTVDRDALPERIVAPGEVDGQELAEVDDVLARTTAFAGVLANPADLIDPVRTRLLEVLSAAWRSAPQQRTAIIEDAAGAADTRSLLVTPTPGSTLNLINAEAQIPVAVSNDLGQAAHVEVRLLPRDPRLRAPEPVPLVVPAHQSATAQVPVHAVGSGDVIVDVVLTSPDGDRIDAPIEIKVRVRADWETVGTAIVAGLLVIMLVVGLIRTVRRARRHEPPPAHARQPSQPTGDGS